MAKLWLLDSNSCQSNRAQWKNLRAFLWLLDIITGNLLLYIINIIIIVIIIIIIILFVYLSIFIANEFLLTTVNKNFS